MVKLRSVFLKLIFSTPFDIFWMSIVFMWLMPFGTFDYGAPGFYLCIAQAVINSVSIRLLLKKHQKDQNQIAAGKKAILETGPLQVIKSYL